MSKISLQQNETVSTAHEFKQAITSALLNNSEIVIDATALETADLSCLQTLIALSRSTAQRGIGLRTGDLDGTALGRAFERAGIDPRLLDTGARPRADQP